VLKFSEFSRTDLPAPGCAKIRSNQVVVRFVPVWYGQTFPSGVRKIIEPALNGLEGRCQGMSFIISVMGAMPVGAVPPQ
jgi:hypothetical protein